MSCTRPILTILCLPFHLVPFCIQPVLAAAESTNTRVKWWSIIQGFILVAVCSCQVYFVKRHFEVRRVV